MRRITSNVEARILEMLLAGATYREIAREQDVTISTVNRFVEDERRRTPDFDEIRRLRK
jgi:DNA invertase Pin-like site-specific DNA recombinase